MKFFANSFTKQGVPDILACVNGYFLAIEVKAPQGKPSELQKHNVEKINDAQGFAIILYPQQFEQFQKLIVSLEQSKLDYANLICKQINEGR